MLTQLLHDLILDLLWKVLWQQVQVQFWNLHDLAFSNVNCYEVFEKVDDRFSIVFGNVDHVENSVSFLLRGFLIRQGTGL